MPNHVTRLGLFGGSFNPVHLGHLLVAQAAREELHLDRVVFIPAAQSPFKPGLQLAPAERRLQMLRLALAGCSGCEVDDQEIERGGISYTIDTVRAYLARFADAELFYLIGADHVAQLGAWRDAAELARMVQFLIIPRPGKVAEMPPAPFRAVVLQGFPIAISASQIRQRVKEGKPIDWLVPSGVAEVIRNNRLYI
ncbi:MAG: nicotinate-nucleotide adenylyltransferase [Verrucomicrobiota bacterium]